MNIAIFGTGVVGRMLASKCSELGHGVAIGTRDIQSSHGSEDLKQFLAGHSEISLRSFPDAAKFGELAINAVSGANSIAALKMAGADNLRGKVLIDISNPLDFSAGMPPTLSICNTFSLGEEIQSTFPETKVVKTLNTMTAALMVYPSLLPGDHNVFINGNESSAKAEVVDLLQQFGWKAANILDLGDISASRGVEMYLPIWLRLYGSLETAVFNIHVVK